ncbi:hypothetical protein QBC39DRAFT_374306 [Podospora conica]|nr:hypothetical protein QBC39DRAFT_374306 [Schizothecium conicum]
MRPTSDLQLHAPPTDTVPGPEQARKEIRTPGTPTPDGHTAHPPQRPLMDTRGGCHVIDPRWDSAANQRGHESALAALGDVRSITATHRHPNHIGMAARLQTESSTTVQVEERTLVVRSWWERTPGVLRQQLDAWSAPTSRRFEFDQYVRACDCRTGVSVAGGTIIALAEETAAGPS